MSFSTLSTTSYVTVLSIQMVARLGQTNIEAEIMNMGSSTEEKKYFSIIKPF